MGAGFAALAVATGVSVLSFTLFPQRVEFGGDGRAYLQSSSLRSYYERSERLRPQEFVAGALYAFRKQSDKSKALQILDAYVREYKEFYDAVAPEARRLATPTCWVFLRRALRKRYLLVADVLHEIGETKMADQLLGKAKAIEQQLEKMRDG